MAKDIFHATVKKALEKDGWTITHDPYYLNDKIKNIKYEIDLGAEKLLAAEKIKKYKTAILNVLKSYQRPSTTIETLLLADTDHHHYQVVEAGWQDPDRYYYGILFHIHIKPTGKVVILENNTDDDLAESLIDNGVLKSDIVINFIPERVRQYTGYAVA